MEIFHTFGKSPIVRLALDERTGALVPTPALMRTFVFADEDMMRAQIPTAIVTGAAGFIGSHLSARLVADGWSVLGIDDERTGSWTRVTGEVGRLERDLTELDEDDMRDALGGADVLFHLAAEKHLAALEAPERVLEVNVTATARLFRAAVAAGVGKVVFTSSLYAYGSMGPKPMAESDVPVPRTTYGVSKLAGEHLLRVASDARSVPWTAARLFFVYGPRQHAKSGYRSVIHANFARILRGERPAVYGDGLQSLDYVYVDDCVDALVRMTDHEHDGLTVNVASGRAVAVADLTRLMLDVAESDAEPVTCPPDWTAGSARVGSTELASKRLGWQATTSLREGLGRVWSWMAADEA